MIKNLFRSKSQTTVLIIFHILFLAIVLTNFPSGQWFVGWDSIHPEFDFLLNFKRAIFAGGWQENYGVGTLTGHGFAALLVHTLITFLMSFLMPLAAIRPAFTLLCLYLGGLGLYFLVRFILNLISKRYHVQLWQKSESLLDGIALLASLYYLFNLATVQIFYVQLEAFIVHFAALPWLFLSVIKLIEKRSRKNILIFALINFLATIQGFIPPLFVTYATALALFLLIFLISQQWSKAALKSSVIIVLFTFFINAFWFLPVAYFTFTRGDTYLNSYNNLISTPEFVQESQKFGDLKNAALLKGFYWDSHELGGPILTPWIKHQEGMVPLIGYLIFGIAGVGLFAGVFLIRDWIVRALSIIGLYFFASLAVATPPFSAITFMLQWLSPTYNQAFRAAFTKFGLGTGFIYSLLFAVGLFTLVTVYRKYFKSKLMIYSLITILGLSLVWYAWPLFQGNLIYKKLLLSIPKSYFELITYFKDQGDGRIADFPQDCPEGWYSYQWGYFGSGFLWYGIRQPILARSFDVWSPRNENYYWEMIQAVREHDFNRVDKILDKYDVKWLLYDQNFIYCRTQRGAFATTDFINYVKSSPNYHLVKRFEAKGALPISVYERIKREGTYAGTVTDLRNIGPIAAFDDQDNAFNKYGIYTVNNENNYDIYYPLLGLFSKRGLADKATKITAAENKFVLTSQLPKNLEGYSLRLPRYSIYEKYIPFSIGLNRVSGTIYEVKLVYQLPKILLDGQALTRSELTQSLGRISIRNLNGISIYVNGVKVESQNGVYQAVFLFGKENTLQIINGSQNLAFKLGFKDKNSNEFVNAETIVALPKFTKGELQIMMPKVNGEDISGIKSVSLSSLIPLPCNEPTPSGRNKYEIGNEGEQEYVRMISQDSRQCLTIPLSGLSTSTGYIFEINTRHVSGGNLLLSVNNKDQLAGLDVYLPKESKLAANYYIMPPTFPSEVGYNLVLQNASFSKEPVVNDVSKAAAWYLPYNYLKNIEVERLGFGGITDNINPTKIQKIDASHPNETFYEVRLNPDRGNYLLLSQGYDKGWFAFVPPFRPLKHHILVSNWMNGWDITELKGSQASVAIIIVFWPQYLEYLGFVLLSIPFIYALWPRKKKREEFRKLE